MSDLFARFGLIAGALLIAWLVTVALRRRSSGSPRKLAATGLDAGAYLFTSTACADCGPTRRQLDESLGKGGYTEVSWEEEPGLFHQLGINAVPATLIVDAGGSATLYPGRADKALVVLGP
jgi:hypothetical protein